jgi:eukaryotic-like serine/threonine-protein kinase
MLKRFGKTQDPLTADKIAKACLLLPDDDKETELAHQLADRAVTRGKNNQWARYFVFCKGLADYRRGNFRAVADGLDPLVAQGGPDSRLTASCHLVLAMALQRQGEAKAAREQLAQAAKILDQHVPDLARFPMNDPQQYDHDWLIAWLLHREAQTLLAAEKAEPKK